MRKEFEFKGVRFIVVDVGDVFWRVLYVFLLLGRDYCWCCKVMKFGLIMMVIKENYLKGVLMFVG